MCLQGMWHRACPIRIDTRRGTRSGDVHTWRFAWSAFVGRAFMVRHFLSSRSDMPPSGLYGPTAIPSRSDIFMRLWRAKNVGPEGADLRRPIPSRGRDRSPVGRAFTVRHPSFREATFARGGGAPKMSDLKAPTYKNQCPRGDATCPRRSGLYGPTAIPSRSDICKRRWCAKDVGPEGADLRRPIPRKSTCPSRSGLYGPTAIP
jgi:hypothetical protein